MWKIIPAGNENINVENDNNVSLLKKLSKIKHELNSEKSRLDIFEKDPLRFKIIRNVVDHFSGYKSMVARTYAAKNVSNAWLKMYEILYTQNFVEDIIEQKGSFTSFHNAEFPGSFLLATSHYLDTVIGANNTSFEWTWWASSYIGNPKDYLQDSYELYKNYKDHWIMNETYNGDVMNIEFQKYISRKIGGTVDLYTADLGFGFADENNQELDQARANLGQIISGLVSLAPGGILVTKQYTIFEPISISIIALIAPLFKEFYILKPLTSRELNSETYLFGKGFIGLPDNIRVILYKKLEIYDHTPIIPIDQIDPGILNSIYIFSATLAKRQIEKIKEFFDYYTETKYIKNLNDPNNANYLRKKVYALDAEKRDLMKADFDEKIKFFNAKNGKYDLDAKKVF